ncbi:MAG: hypothetical protein M3Q71_14960 [Chloroflexota bacterium]|nr:hypothetical protein [Chloroflexota bacterium]
MLPMRICARVAHFEGDDVAWWKNLDAVFAVFKTNLPFHQRAFEFENMLRRIDPDSVLVVWYR